MAVTVGKHHLLFKPKLKLEQSGEPIFLENKQTTGAKFQYSRNWQLNLRMLLGHKLTVSHSDEPKQRAYSLNVKSRKKHSCNIDKVNPNYKAWQ